MSSVDATDAILAVLEKTFSSPIARALLTVTRRREALEHTPLTDVSLRRAIIALERSLPAYVADPMRRAECARELRKLIPEGDGESPASDSASRAQAAPPRTAGAMKAAPPVAPPPSDRFENKERAQVVDRGLASAAATAATILRISSPEDFQNASDVGRDLCRQLGFGPLDQTKVSTAICELTRNILQYAGRGEIKFAMVSTPRKGIEVHAVDYGPGIADLSLVMSSKYRSRTGMGMGLKGTKRIVDEFEIESVPGRGTRVVFRKYT
ncbi:MAG: anti-sigma regulatory factor [Polyangiaceae bacterium]